MGNFPPSILRQPPSPSPLPPPPRHDSSLMAINEEEGNTQRGIVGGNRTRICYFRRCKRKRSMDMESLPDDLLFEILVRLPALDIYDRARLVCRKWYHMIYTHNFILAHLQHTTYGLLYVCVNNEGFFMDVREGRIEISKLNYECRFEFWASCNGLILELELECGCTLYIVNPVTKQVFVLPPISRPIISTTQYVIAYAAASMEYKVVVIYPLEPNPSEANPTLQPCAILTVGVDKSWRIVRTQHLPFMVQRALLAPPLVTEGFVHWATSANQVLTLNVETEIMTETPAPIPRVHGSHRTYMSTGRYLSLLITCGEFLWEVWEMKPQTGEWRKLPDIITLEAQKRTFKLRFGFDQNELLIPVGWLKYLEVLVFSVSGSDRCRRFIFLYNLLKQEIDSIEVPRLYRCWPLVHRNSLVWLA